MHFSSEEICLSPFCYRFVGLKKQNRSGSDTPVPGLDSIKSSYGISQSQSHSFNRFPIVFLFIWETPLLLLAGFIAARFMMIAAASEACKWIWLELCHNFITHRLHSIARRNCFSEAITLDKKNGFSSYWIEVFSHIELIVKIVAPLSTYQWYWLLQN